LADATLPLALLIDYDGTIAFTDVSDSIMIEFVPPPIWDQLEKAYETGRMGSREVMEREVALLPPDPARVQAIADAQPHDPAFAGFVHRASAAGIPVEIVSDGLGFFIEPAMRRLGVASEVTITTATTTLPAPERPGGIAFPNGHPSCFVCGTCKRQRVLAHQAAGRTVVFIGDGESDRYAAGYADFVFAKRALVPICEGYGWPYAPWDGFAELDGWLAVEIEAMRCGHGTIARRPTTFFCGPEVWGPGPIAPPTPFAVPGGEGAPIGHVRPAAPAEVDA
jgi:2-hydroxy-3-keto-5-methylthiopentenyl-1-phosphate phosphatase